MRGPNCARSNCREPRPLTGGGSAESSFGRKGDGSAAKEHSDHRASGVGSPADWSSHSGASGRGAPPHGFRLKVEFPTLSSSSPPYDPNGAPKPRGGGAVGDATDGSSTIVLPKPAPAGACRPGSHRGSPGGLPPPLPALHMPLRSSPSPRFWTESCHVTLRTLSWASSLSSLCPLSSLSWFRTDGLAREHIDGAASGFPLCSSHGLPFCSITLWYSRIIASCRRTTARAPPRAQQLRAAATLNGQERSPTGLEQLYS